MGEKWSFSFGKNWWRFLNTLDEAKHRDARSSLTQFLNSENLRGKTFLDAGCGSGLFSNAAYDLGAEKIVSFDLDPFSVRCCNYLHEKVGKPENWEVHEGSVLDSEFLSKLGKFDIVYSWGVLHHTGKMWDGIFNTANLVKEGGCYYIAIYNKVIGGRSSEFWLKVKKIYNALPEMGKRSMEFLYVLIFSIRRLLRFQNPIKDILAYKVDHRGMNWQTDIRDWLGGYPYEFATAEEVFKYMKSNFPNFNLVNLKSADNVGANWFLFTNSPIASGKFALSS